MAEEYKPKYINPLTDFGFKRIFGTAANSDLLIDFLNCMLPLPHPIMKLTYKNVEQIPNLEEDRKVIYDLFCIDTEKNEFIIEMQKAKLTFFKDRAMFYLTFPIQSQAEKGKWNFKLKPIYYLTLLNFYHEPKQNALLEREVQLKDQNNAVFYDKLMLKFVQLPVFKKKEKELITRKDKWLYYLKNLENMETNIPEIFTADKVFTKALKVTEIAALSPDEYQNYQVSRMQYLEISAALETAFDDGAEKTAKKYEQKLKKAEQKAEEAEQKAEEAEQKAEEERKQKEEALNKQKRFAKRLLNDGMNIEEAADYLEMSVEELKNWLEA